MTKEKPYLSIIIAGRNDNYGGDFIFRLQNCITWNTELLEKYRVNTEFIIVNWNPIDENLPIDKSVNFIKKREFVKYKIITVPKNIHLQFCNDSRKHLPLFEYIAKNVGIKRSKGEFVLSMNPDILIDEKIIKKIAERKLQIDRFYRADRVDFTNNDINNQTIIWMKGFTYSVKPPMFFLKFKNKMSCLWRSNSIKCESFFQRRNWNVYYHNTEYKYHCNVSGDFMMMHKSIWDKLRGHPEKTYLPLHIDALMVIISAMGGLKEYIFKKPIYHQEHKRRFNATEENNNENRAAYLYFQQEAQKMIKKQKPTIYNDKNWGLTNFELKEDCF